MTPQKPSLDLLRRLTDSHVVGAVVDRGRLTRAEIATVTGISKPTVAESVRRLESTGVLADTGVRSSGPGRAGLYYDLAPGVGTALAVAIAPEGVVAEVIDVRGAVVGRGSARVTRPVRPAAVGRALTTAVRAALAQAAAPQEAVDQEAVDQEAVDQEAVDRPSAAGTAPVRLAVVSAADPVDRATGRLVHLPDAPFLVGDLDPAAVLADIVEGPVVVGNDVNWSALAELAAHSGQPEDPEAAAPTGDFAYLYLGEGLGCAVVANGRVLEGAHGLAGEVSHVVVGGPGRRAMPFTAVFAELGLRHDGGTAVDVARLRELVHGTGPRSRRGLAALAGAVADVVAALVALADPHEVVLGGPWGRDPQVVAAVRDRVASAKRPVGVRGAMVVDAALTGAREHAVAALRAQLVGDQVPAASP
ncbi:ROK family transcriptional regulator [Phycicoccus ginsengisoli]